MEFTDGEGELLVRMARNAVEEFVRTGKTAVPEDVPERFRKKKGVFVTLKKAVHGEEELRGCVGFPLPSKPLIEALVEAGVKSASEDPRFPPVEEGEIDSILVEVSALTEPQLLRSASPKDYPSMIRVGEDGLIIEWRLGSGLLLPQVPLEFGWDAEDFLSHASMKAGGPPDLWLLDGTKVYKFRAEVFGERSPKGTVTRTLRLPEQR